jgi:UDP-3-O-[3-hydroxymyristoyl] glucosamine N-acyltransferase
MTTTVGKLAEITGGVTEGDAGRAVAGVCPLSEAKEGYATFVENQKAVALLEGKNPAVVICGGKIAVEGQTLIRSDNPRLSFALAINFFHPRKKPDPGIHPSAVVDPAAVVDAAAVVGPNCCVAARARIGAGTVLLANVYIGADAVVGMDCFLNPNVSVMERCEIGDRVILHSGVVVGADGFGFVWDGERHRKVPQVGNVVIEDEVEIGANSAVDRATLGETRIGRGAKIDNLVQIGHNVSVGEHAILCGCVGISGSVRIGARAILGGQAGVSDHVEIGEGAMIGGKAGVTDNVPPGVFYSGFPARPHRENMKTLSALVKLPDLVEKINSIEEQLKSK